jgi:hypothetical protein
MGQIFLGYIHEEDPYPRRVSLEPFPPASDGAKRSMFGSMRGRRWKELDENLQGFASPEETENGLFEGFAAAGERDCGGFADVSRMPDNDS